jgi:hypothetical protein
VAIIAKNEPPDSPDHPLEQVQPRWHRGTEAVPEPLTTLRWRLRRSHPIGPLLESGRIVNHEALLLVAQDQA